MGMRSLLSGVRVVDLTWVGAGPFSSQLLAYLGAEVIKIESAERPDLFRRSTDPKRSGLDASTRFNSVNCNKLSVCLSLSSEKGRDLLKRLVAVSDVVTENFRPGVLQRLGLGYEVLKEINPRIVFASLSAAGQTGPESSSPGYASVFNALGGLGDQTGYPDGPPVEVRDSVDFRVGTAMTFGILAALVHRTKSGKGQSVDTSARETVASLIGESFVELALSGRAQTRNGNHRDGFAPHDVFRCRGEDSWIAIAIADDTQWRLLCRAMGNEDLAQDRRFADSAERQRNIAMLNGIISDWTRHRTPAEAEAALNAQGVAASAVNPLASLPENPHLAARGLLARVDHEILGPQYIVGPPWRTVGAPDDAPLKRAPLLGEHTEKVLTRLLHMTPDEVTALKKEGVLV